MARHPLSVPRISIRPPAGALTNRGRTGGADWLRGAVEPLGHYRAL